MRILVVTQGQWGQRIVEHLQCSAPSDWQISTWRGPTAFPAVLDEPENYLPDALPQADLLLVLTESVGMTDLSPDLAQLCGARAVIVPVDDRRWAPPGLVRQVKRRLEALGVDYALPMPFCSLTPKAGHGPLICAFSELYGRPSLTCAVEGDRVVSCEIVRQTPCGNTQYIVERLPGVATDEATEQAGLLHHYYPCWGGMSVDPVQGAHTLLHIAATMAQRSVQRALEPSEKGQVSSARESRVR
jgi:hypothetical protein